LAPYYNAKYYTVTYDVNGGKLQSGISNYRACYDSPFALLVPIQNPTKKFFAGWYSTDGTKLTGADGKGVSVWDWANNMTAVAKWVTPIESATFTDNTKYTIKDDGVTKNPIDKISFTSLFGHTVAEYLAVGYQTVSWEIKIKISEIDDGYQEFYVSTKNTTTDGNIFQYTVIEHGSGKTDTSVWTHTFTPPNTNLSVCKDTMYVLYGAHGSKNDDWYRHSISVKMTLS